MSTNEFLSIEGIDTLSYFTVTLNVDTEDVKALFEQRISNVRILPSRPMATTSQVRVRLLNLLILDTAANVAKIKADFMTAITNLIGDQHEFSDALRAEMEDIISRRVIVGDVNTILSSNAYMSETGVPMSLVDEDTPAVIVVNTVDDNAVTEYFEGYEKINHTTLVSYTRPDNVLI